MRGRRRREHGAAEEDLRRRGRGRGRGRRGAGRDGGGSVHGRRARGRVSPRRSPESESETAARKRESARRLETKKRREKRGGEERRGGEGGKGTREGKQLNNFSFSLYLSRFLFFFSLSLSNSLSCSFTLFLLACVVYSLGSMGYLSSLPRDSFGMYLFEDYRVYTGICSHLNVPVVIDVAAGLIRGRAHELAADRVDLA